MKNIHGDDNLNTWVSIANLDASTEDSKKPRNGLTESIAKADHLWTAVWIFQYIKTSP